MKYITAINSTHKADLILQDIGIGCIMVKSTANDIFFYRYV